VPELEIPAQLLIEHAGSDLQQMVGSRWSPPHLLFLHKPLTDNLVDRGFNEAGRNGLTAVKLNAAHNVTPSAFSACHWAIDTTARRHARLWQPQRSL
jgi:hypothetical protein